MSNHEVRLARGSLRIDGTEYAHAVVGADVAVAPGSYPAVTLTLIPGNVQIIGPVSIDAGTHALLVDLGWTPPAEGGDQS